MSETINVVIEIPAELYAYHKYGIPLSEVLAEIEAEIEKDSKEWLGLDFYDGINNAIEIIDKHMDKGGKEALEKSAGIEQIIWERDLAIQQLKSLGYGLGEKPKENKGEWIPIESEEKPDDYTRVLITLNGCRGLIVREAKYYKAQNEFEVLHNYERWEVGEKGLLAWQPLPKPYEAESEE